MVVKVEEASALGIQGLKWTEGERELQGKKDHRHVDFEGTYEKDALWTLIREGDVVKRNADGEFKLQLEVPSEEGVSRVELTAIGPRGEIEREVIGIASKKLSEEARREYFKRVAASAGLGFTFVDYQDNQSENFTETAITLNARILYFLVPRKWDIGASGYFTILPLSSTSAASRSPRFFGLNARVGYVLPFVHSPWRLSLLVGIYYATMLSADTPSIYGFRNVSGPQVYPLLTRIFSLRHSAYVYGKYSPINNGISKFLSIGSNSEIAAGGGYVWRFESGGALTASLDFSMLSLKIGSAVAKVSTFSIGASYGF